MTLRANDGNRRAYDRTRRRRHGQHLSSATTEHHSNANNLELGSVPPVDVQVADEIGQKVKTPVATTCNLYDRVSILPSEEDVEDEDDECCRCTLSCS